MKIQYKFDCSCSNCEAVFSVLSEMQDDRYVVSNCPFCGMSGYDLDVEFIEDFEEEN